MYSMSALFFMAKTPGNLLYVDSLVGQNGRVTVSEIVYAYVRQSGAFGKLRISIFNARVA